jgi:hypothetical protein
VPGGEQRGCAASSEASAPISALDSAASSLATSLAASSDVSAAASAEISEVRPAASFIAVASSTLFSISVFDTQRTTSSMIASLPSGVDLTAHATERPQKSTCSL